MKLKDLEQAFLDSCSKLSTAPLARLNPDIYYSYLDKQSFIKQIENKFEGFKAQGITEIIIINSKCRYCYPKAIAYCIYDKEYNFLTKYVIDQDGCEDFVFEECKNNPIPDGEDGLPF